MNAALDSVLYPAIEPFDSGFLPTPDGHNIYYEQSGSSSGTPALFLHGGPGGGSGPRHRRFFDPLAYRVILMDQRGCGRSTPHASLHSNTTWHLVEDIERLRVRLCVDKWLLFGGSWGSTLALAYAQRYPEAVRAFVLRGVFLVRTFELAWFYQSGANMLFPDAWGEFCRDIPVDERADMLRAYYSRLISDNAATRLQAARSWIRWEKRTSYLLANEEEILKADEEEYSVAFARIEAHYFVHRAFLESDRQLIDGLDRLKGKPAIIVQGRYDLVCPAITAMEVHARWADSQLRVVPDAGHSAFEPSNAAALVRATDELRDTR
jgi:proline iminopeptidase